MKVIEVGSSVPHRSSGMGHSRGRWGHISDSALRNIDPNLSLNSRRSRPGIVDTGQYHPPILGEKNELYSQGDPTLQSPTSSRR
jgi:hypothetical protein